MPAMIHGKSQHISNRHTTLGFPPPVDQATTERLKALTVFLNGAVVNVDELISEQLSIKEISR